MSRVEIPDLARAVRASFRRSWRALLLTGVTIRILSGLLTLAGSALLISLVSSFEGRPAVTNEDIAAFLLNARGIAGVILAGCIALAVILAEQAAFQAAASLGLSSARMGMRIPVRAAGRAIAGAVGGAFVRLVGMGALQTLAMLIVLLPGAGLLGLIWRSFLSGHDINYYLSSKPPAFLAAGALGGLVGLAVLAAVLTLYVRWIIAVPILLFEGARPLRSLHQSAARVRGSRMRIAAILVAWHAGMLGLSALVFALFRLAAAGALDAAGTGVAAVATVVALLLLAQGILGALLTFLAAAGHALIVFRLYVLARPAGERAAALSLAWPGMSAAPGRLAASPRGMEAGESDEAGRRAPSQGAASAPDPRSSLRGRPGESVPGAGPGADGRSMAPVWAACSFVLLIVVAAGAVVLPRFVSARPVEITAHRGYSRAAPENSLSAFRKAIEAGADWAELDVQETADNVIVVIHDRDLMRMAGDPRRVSDLTLEELQQVDIGTKFSPEFAGERVPTLKEVIALARGRIRLNIELKYYGKDPRLAPDVARLLHEEQFEDQCLVMSLFFDGPAEAHAVNPAVRTGAIVTAALGDISRLQADVLSVNAKKLTGSLLRSARRHGKGVHVWTVDQEKTALRLMQRGVDNIITNDPPMLLRLRREWIGLPGGARLLLASRALLGLQVEEPEEGEAAAGEL